MFYPESNVRYYGGEALPATHHRGSEMDQHVYENAFAIYFAGVPFVRAIVAARAMNGNSSALVVPRYAGTGENTGE